MSNLVNNILNTLNAQQNTNISKEDLNMKATENMPASRPATFSESQWKRATYTAYMDLVAIVERRMTIAQYLKAHAGLFMGCGVPADEQHMLSLVIAMAKDTTVDHEKVRKVVSVASLRQFFNGAWQAKDAMKVVYKAPSKPQEHQPRAKKSPEETVVSLFSKMTDAEKAALVAKLLAA